MTQSLAPEVQVSPFRRFLNGNDRVGARCTNIFTPLMGYFGLMLTSKHKYDPKGGIGAPTATMAPSSPHFLIGSMPFLIAWNTLVLPIGSGAPLFLIK